MAENTAQQISTDEQIAQAQELLSIATRNYYVKAYSDAADDFSTACSILSEVYGPSADALGKPYLLYAKCLIALGQEENKIMEIPEEQEEDDDDEEEEEEDDGREENGAGVNGPSEGTAAKPTEGAVDPAQPGTSTGITESAMDNNTSQEDEDGDVGNLQVAWEVLELAVGIFSRNPERRKDLAESYIELAGISFENSNFEAAVKDFQQALDVLGELSEKNFRELAEINYKIGLAYSMLNQFDESSVYLKRATCNLDEIIKAEEGKENITPEDAAVISDLKETKGEIENKIAEVMEYKEQSLEEVKREISKLVGTNEQPKPNSSSAPNPQKPASDISHLIKRKRRSDEVDTSSAVDSAASQVIKRSKD